MTNIKLKIYTISFLILTVFISCKFEKNKNDINQVEQISGAKKLNKTKNPVGYFEIPVLDLEKSMQFYKAVFGFEFEKNKIDGNEMAFFPFNKNAEGISGSLSKGKTYKPSKNGNLIYFNSENIDATLLKVQQNGGKILYPKTDIGTLGFVAEFEDVEGNRIGLHKDK